MKPATANSNFRSRKFFEFRLLEILEPKILKFLKMPRNGAQMKAHNLLIIFCVHRILIKLIFFQNLGFKIWKFSKIREFFCNTGQKIYMNQYFILRNYVYLVHTPGYTSTIKRKLSELFKGSANRSEVL